MLHKLGADLSVVNERGYPFYIFATEEGSLDILKTIVTDVGVHPNSTNYCGMTMMIAASYYGRVDKLKTLVDLGADVNQADKNGGTLNPKVNSNSDLHPNHNSDPNSIRENSDIRMRTVRARVSSRVAVQTGSGCRQSYYERRDPCICRS